MKKIIFKKKPIVCLTAYNKYFAEIIDEFCDLILVGDSLGMAYYGDTSTRGVTLDEIIRHGKSVRKGVKNAVLVVDMPHNTYKTNIEAKKNATKIIRETKCDAVKLEGGKEVAKIIKFLVKNKINVMGHIGLLPQKAKSSKDFSVKGKNIKEIKKLFSDLESIQKAGVFSIVLEAVKNKISIDLVKKSRVPIIGIGASKNCDGQILVLEDLLGFFDKAPKFVKKYMNIRSQIKKATKNFSKDVRKKVFPSKTNVYL